VHFEITAIPQVTWGIPLQHFVLSSWFLLTGARRVLRRSGDGGGGEGEGGSDDHLHWPGRDERGRRPGSGAGGSGAAASERRAPRADLLQERPA